MRWKRHKPGERAGECQTAGWRRGPFRGRVGGSGRENRGGWREKPKQHAQFVCSRRHRLWVSRFALSRSFFLTLPLAVSHTHPHRQTLFSLSSSYQHKEKTPDNPQLQLMQRRPQEDKKDPRHRWSMVREASRAHPCLWLRRLVSCIHVFWCAIFIFLILNITHNPRDLFKQALSFVRHVG